MTGAETVGLVLTLLTIVAVGGAYLVDQYLHDASLRTPHAAPSAYCKLCRRRHH